MLTSALVLLAGLLPLAAADTDAWTRMETTFRDVPMEARRLTGPLFWLHGDDKETPERLRLFLDKVKEGGNGSFCAESRPHSDWLGPRWYADLEVCLQHARENDLKMWIFDDVWWPSQTMGGKVPQEYSAKRLTAAATAVTGPAKVDQEMDTQTRFVALLAGRDTGGGIDGASLVDLAAMVKDGRLSWDAPEGNWQIMRFGWDYAPPSEQGGKVSLDGASKDAVDWFMNTVYQPHYDRFKEDFGKTIPGFFYDEPETQGDWGTELAATFAERGTDWRKALVAWKFTLAGEEQAAAKYAYADAFFETWGRTLYGTMTRWCESWGGQSIGHFMEHDFLYLKHGLGPGNLFQMQKYSSMGGMDLVCHQMTIGERRRDIYQLPKLTSSISHVYGKKDDLAMCEIFGGYDQELTYPEMKWLTDHHQVRGVNFMITHSFNPRAPEDTDYPPYFYNMDKEPRWPLYKVWADYNSRLAAMLTGGRHVCPVALLFCGNSGQAGRAVTPEDMTTALQDALYDCDWLPYDVFEKEASFDGAALRLGRESYRVLIVPPVEAIPVETLRKVRDFLNAGGVVAGYGFLPAVSATPGGGAAEIASLCMEIWGESPAPSITALKVGATGGRAYFFNEAPTAAEISAALLRDAGVTPVLEVMSGDTGGWVHALHRMRDGGGIFFICNQDPSGAARELRLRAAADGVPERWDPMRGLVESLPCSQAGEGLVDFDLRLESMESALVVFRSQGRPLPLRPASAAASLTVPVEVPTAPRSAAAPAPEQLSLDGCQWVWYPGENALNNAMPGTRIFTGRIEIPADAAVSDARFLLSVDNEFVFSVNGVECGRSSNGAEGWRTPAEVDIRAALKPGANQVQIIAINTSRTPSPAGLIGCYRIALGDGTTVSGAVDRTWKVARATSAGKTQTVQCIAEHGAAPWGRIQKRQTAPAAPFDGAWDWTEAPPEGNRRVLMFMEGVREGARVTINGQDAGGCIGAPHMLDVTRHVRQGANTVHIEPYAPERVTVAVY